ncbi:DUF2079 domain-containing protein [Leptolyngbya sp. CCY15150]|uniref:DUF2079 domain-containing protein n=1 Tax=Leptolyngbya sp. CCY15150 TaxID=2767772 RepID=UPI001EF327EF|nr:DUF2079 domain-containing protein [Leptolyngbya sp. CCY15150]
MSQESSSGWKWQTGPMVWEVSRGALMAAALFWVVVLVLVLHRHHAMYPSYASFDQGIFNQVFWNNSHGRWFQSSLSSSLSTPVVHDGQVPDVSYRRLGQHFTPALLLWLPIYAIAPSPTTLFIIQVTLVTLAGLVLYNLARCYLTPQLSTLIAISYYGANSVIGPSLANFHDICQLPLFFFSLFLALEKRWWALFWIMAGLILLVREDAGVALFGVGVYLLVSRRYPWLGAILCGLSLGYMLLLTNLIMPLFSEDISRRFMIEQFGQYVEGDEASTLDVIGGMVSNPGRLLQELVNPLGDKIRYLLGHWLPLMFIPAIAPSAWLLAGVPLLKTFLRQDPIALSINLRYSMNIVPGLFYGAVLWWSVHPQAIRQRWVRGLWIAAITLSILFTITSNPNRSLSFIIPDSIQPQVYLPAPQQWQHVAKIRGFMAEIPRDASVSATSHIVAHLSSRRQVLRFPDLSLQNDADEVVEMDYVLLDLEQLVTYQTVFADDRQRLQRAVRVVDRILERDRYGVQGFTDGILFLRRATPSQPDALAAWQAYRQAIAAAVD